MVDTGMRVATASRVTYRLGRYEVTAPTGFGPRLMGLKAGESPEMLLRLDPDVTLDAGEHGPFRYRGGHRLWASPESPHLTYVPDERPCAVAYEDGALRISGPVDDAGFGKELEVRAQGEQLVVDHRLSWEGNEPVTAGAWAITQLPLGGTALLPLGGDRAGASQRPDRTLVLWPYTDLADPRISFLPAAAKIDARSGPPLKLGSGPVPGRLGYLRDGWLFTKSVEPARQCDYPDRGAVGQVSVNGHFCDLASLGPLAELAPGCELRHREVWQVSECSSQEMALGRVLQAG